MKALTTKQKSALPRCYNSFTIPTKEVDYDMLPFSEKCSQK
jgi:hypothetical protein